MPPRRIHATSRITRFPPSLRPLTQLFRLLDTHPREKIPPGTLSIAFLDDATLCHLHQQYLNDPTPTDVITFPADPADPAAGPPHAGEICISIPQARRAAPLHGNTTAQEILLYLVHGWLHLAGHTDHTPATRRAMRQAEQRALAHLHNAGFRAPAGWR
jgi:probable rRNA maturation factor